MNESGWSVALAERRRLNLPIHDLTTANPPECGFEYPADTLEPLLNPRGLHYTADPMGLLVARESVCSYYRELDNTAQADARVELHPRQICLTTSTSEAYSFLFRLLCDPNDEVLIAQPSYPLFDFLADLDDVRLVPYPLFYDHGWHIDVHALRTSITEKTRAIVVVHPNNPTGHFATIQDRLYLEQLCREFNLSLIVDEVFIDYAYSDSAHSDAAKSFTLGDHPVLTFVLSGLSKVAGLPQMKLSWIVACGPEAELAPALTRLEVVADTFLSVSAPTQLALPVWLVGRHSMRQQIRDRVEGNLRYLDKLLTHNNSINRLEVEGGWYAILRIPSHAPGETIVEELISRFGVAVHHGVYFGLPANGYLVISLLASAKEFAAGSTNLFLAIDVLTR